MSADDKTIEEKIEEIELKPTIKINPNFGTQQVYSPSTDTYIPDWRTQPLTLIPEIYVMDKLQTLDASKIAWTKKNGALGANEVVSDGILTINKNVLSESKTATYVVVYNYAEGKSVSTELSFSLVKDGTEPADGKDAAMCLIVPSGTSFASHDGTNYLPASITLTPQFQGCGFDLWQYSNDGINWKNVVSGQNGLTIDSNHILTISNTTPLLTDTQKCLNIKLLSNQLNVISVITITKVKDGQNGKQGSDGSSLLTFTTNYTANQTQIDNWSKYGYTSTWNVNESTGTTKVGDTVLLQIKSLIKNGNSYIIAKVQRVVSDKSLALYSIGLLDKGDTGPQGPKGDIGEQGPQGIQGPKGADGKQYYTWLKYADTPTSGMSDNPTGKNYIGLAYNKTTATESNNYSDYSWSLIKGEKGDTGVPGSKGADGKTLYTWIKYATNASGANMSDSPTGKTYIGFANNKERATERNKASD